MSLESHVVRNDENLDEVLLNAVCGGLPHLRKYDFLNIVNSNIPLRFKATLLISIFITLIAGLRDQIVKLH